MVPRAEKLGGGGEKSSFRFLEALIGQKRKGGEHHPAEEGR